MSVAASVTPAKLGEGKLWITVGKPNEIAMSPGCWLKTYGLSQVLHMLPDRIEFEVEFLDCAKHIGWLVSDPSIAGWTVMGLR
jgi:hypothetical protein